MDLEDIEILNQGIRRMTNRNREVMTGLTAVKRFMRSKIKASYITNFQMGLESCQGKIFLSQIRQF